MIAPDQHEAEVVTHLADERLGRRTAAVSTIGGAAALGAAIGLEPFALGGAVIGVVVSYLTERQRRHRLRDATRY